MPGDGNSSFGIVYSIWFRSSGFFLCISGPGISGAIDVLTGLFCSFFCPSCLYYHSKFSCQNPELLFTPGLTWLWILVAHEVGINEGKLTSEVPPFDAKSWVLVVSRGLGQDDHGVEGLFFSGSVINKAATYSNVCLLLFLLISQKEVASAHYRVKERSEVPAESDLTWVKDALAHPLELDEGEVDASLAEHEGDD